MVQMAVMCSGDGEEMNEADDGDDAIEQAEEKR